MRAGLVACNGNIDATRLCTSIVSCNMHVDASRLCAGVVACNMHVDAAGLCAGLVASDQANARVFIAMATLRFLRNMSNLDMHVRRETYGRSGPGTGGQ